MDQAFPVIIFIAFAALILFLVILGAIQAQKRRKELQKFAESISCSFNPNKNWSFDEQYSSFSHLRQGSNRYAYNIISGAKDNYHIQAFDYHYETHSTDHKGKRQTHHHNFSAVIYHTSLPIQQLFIRPEGFFDKLTEFMGFDDIDFESAEFSKTFFVKAKNKKWAYDVIHQETMEFLLLSPKFTIEFQTPNIIVFDSGTFSINKFKNAMYVVEGILERFPNYLVQELKGESI